MTLRFIILGLLSYMPMSGYDLRIFMNNSTSFFWSAELSQIYRELSKLEKLNYVSSRAEIQEGRPDKKIYSLTQEGYDAFVEWLKDYPKVLSNPGKNEFLVRIFFGAELRKEEMIMLFENYIKEHNKSLKIYEPMEERFKQKLTSEDNDEDDKFLYHYLTLKRGLSWANAEINWANDCIKTIKHFYENKNKDSVKNQND